MPPTDIDQIKRHLGLDTDQDLATRLGVERSAVAQWRRRGVPKRYAHLASGLSDKERVLGLLTDMARQSFFGRAENQYLLKAALAFFDADGLEAEADPLTRGEAREAVLLSLMAFAAGVASEELGMPRCVTDADFRTLMQRLTENHQSELAKVNQTARDRVLNQGPQSSRTAEKASDIGVDH